MCKSNLMFIETLQNAYLAFSERVSTTRTDQLQSIHWFDKRLRAMRDYLQYLSELKRAYNDINVREEYKNFKKFYKNKIRSAKVRANDYLIATSGNPVKSAWNIVNAQREKNTTVVTNNISPDDFNDFFSNIAHDLLNGIPLSARDPIRNVRVTPTNVNFTIPEITFSGTRDIINNLKVKRSKDIYGFNVRIIQSIKNLIIMPLIKLINLFYKESTFPRSLKRAAVIPVFKKGDPESPTNYRLISLLPILSKIIEKSMANKIIQYFENNSLFSPSQFGFRGGKNTVQAILTLISEIMEAYQKKQFDAVLFCDLSKAFDCVDHSILLRKLEVYNFSQGSIQFLR